MKIAENRTGYIRAGWSVQFFLFIGLCLAIVISTGMGYIKISPLNVLKIIAAKLTGHESFIIGMDNLFPVVVTDVRLPRILTASIVGGGLAISGCVFQGILLNPLAGPGTLGVSAGAAFGASVAIRRSRNTLGY